MDIFVCPNGIWYAQALGRKAPMQYNDVDCGVCVCLNAKQLCESDKDALQISENNEWRNDYREENSSANRYNVALELVKKEIL